MRRVCDKSALVFEGLVEAIQELIEGPREVTEFVPGISNKEPVVKIFRADAPGLAAHGHYRRKASASEKIATESRKQNCDRNEQRISLCERLHKFVFAVQGF